MTARCLDPICDDGPTEDEPLPRFADDGSCLCRRCGLLLQQRLAEMPARRDALRATLGGLTASVKGENRPTKGTPPVPLNLAAHDHLTAMHATCVSWVRLVCEERGLRGPGRESLNTLTSWLLSQLDWLLSHGAVGDLADEMRDLSRVADALARTREQWHRLPVKCPGCDAQEIGRWDGADNVACTACGETWHEDDYARLVLILATDQGTSVTATEAARRAGIRPELFRQWVSRGKVRRLGTVDGVARYSTSDLDAVRQDEEGVA